MPRKLLAQALAAAGLLSVLLLATGCCGGVMCGACGPALGVQAVDAVTAQRIDDAECTVSATGQRCDYISEPGTYVVAITAPGYAPVERTYTVAESDGEGCCDCGYEPQYDTVQLSPS